MTEEEREQFVQKAKQTLEKHYALELLLEALNIEIVKVLDTLTRIEKCVTNEGSEKNKIELLPEETDSLNNIKISFENVLNRTNKLLNLRKETE